MTKRFKQLRHSPPLLIATLIIILVIFNYWAFIFQSSRRASLSKRLPELSFHRNFTNKNVSVAYIILIHNNQTARGAARLFKRIYSPENYYVIHIDFDSRDPQAIQYEFLRYCCSERKPPNVHVFSENILKWGSISIVQTELDCLNIALSMGCMFIGFCQILQLRYGDFLLTLRRQWDFAINLSGNCYPVQRMETIYNRLRKMRDSGLNVMTVDGQTSVRIPKKDRRFFVDFVIERHSPDIIRQENSERMPFPDPIEIRQGSQWWILTREFVEYVLTDNFARRLLLYMVNSFIPDEMYFQTVFWNSPWREKGFYEKSSRETKFRYERFSGNNAVTLSHEEVLDAIESGAMFARKFDPNNDALYDTVDNMLHVQPNKIS